MLFHHANNLEELSKIIKTILISYLKINDDILVDVKSCKEKIYSQYIQSEKENSLLIKYPKIAEEWDYEKNENLKPENVTYGSNKRVWWKCSQGHSWQTVIRYRTKYNTKCPECSKKLGKI